MRTKALHYILSFDTQGYEDDIDCSAICGIMSVLSSCCFREYQSIMFLHTDKPSHYHVHLVINPVNICTLKLYEKSFWQTGWEIAGWPEMDGIPLQPFTKRNYKGNIVKGNETGAFVI